MPKLKPNRALRGGKSPVHNSDHRSTLWERRTLMSKQGGLDTITNLQLAHRECNERKGAA